MLQLNDNLIKRIPGEIGALTKLKILLIHNNQITRIPNEMRNLDELTEFGLEWFQYLNPPMSKILKDERGILVIKDFIKFCRMISEVNYRSGCSFACFLTYFHKVQDI